MSKIADFFKFRERNTSYKKELIAGITTFMTMAYVLVVQPGAIVGYGDAAFIIDANGVMITKEAIVVTCAIISGLITLLMALYANLPFALATGMGKQLHVRGTDSEPAAVLWRCYGNDSDFRCYFSVADNLRYP